ncbi:unnamed protein product, partial [Prorocentrum cordatum]
AGFQSLDVTVTTLTSHVGNAGCHICELNTQVAERPSIANMNNGEAQQLKAQQPTFAAAVNQLAFEPNFEEFAEAGVSKGGTMTLLESEVPAAPAADQGVAEPPSEQVETKGRMTAIEPVIQEHAHAGGRGVYTIIPGIGRKLRNQEDIDNVQVVEKKKVKTIVMASVTERVEKIVDAPKAEEKVEVPRLAHREKIDHESLVETQAAEQTVEVAQGNLDSIALTWDEAQMVAQRSDEAPKCILDWMANFPFAGKAEFDGRWKEVEDIARPIFSDITTLLQRRGEQLTQSGECHADGRSLK